MARKRRTRRRTQSSDPIDVVRRLQTALEDGEGAVCLAAKTGEEFEEGVICGKKAEDRRHAISNAAYLKQMAERGLVLSTLPVDATHIAHHTLSGIRTSRKSLPEITQLPPKPTSIKDASTWHFACEEHDARFKPIDEGILFPSSREYMRITTVGATGANRSLEDAIFLMAYRSVLSGLSILRGVLKVLKALRLEKGNHPEIRRQMVEVTRSYNGLMDHKHQYDRRFAGIQGYDMTHHLASTRSHTRLAMSKLVADAVINILPDSGFSRIVVSHSYDITKEKQQEFEKLSIDITRQLSDADNKKPFIDLVANTYDTYIAPADYEGWSERDKAVLMTTAANSIKEFVPR